MNLTRKLFFGIGIAGLLTIGAALGQIVAPPTQLNVNPTDLVQVIPNGVGGSTNVYATIPQIAGAPGYVNGGTIVTTNAFTFPHGVTNYFAHAAGTLASVVPTTEANPSDGQRECYWLDQTTTALTWTANTGQTIGANVVSAGTSKVANCITYVKSSTTWFSSN